MNRVLTHVVILIVALGITFAGFEFWGRFGEAMRNYFDMPVQPAAAGNSSEPFFVTPLPTNAPAQNKPCPKGQTCH